jgi:type VI secretion system protein ImpB
MVMGDFTQRTDDTPLEERKPVRIDKDNFNDVLGQHKLNLSMNVDDKLSGREKEELAVNLKFDSMKDFTPAEVAKQVPELQKLLQLREALTALKGPLANAPAFREKVEELLKDPAQRAKMMKELGLE